MTVSWVRTFVWPCVRNHILLLIYWKVVNFNVPWFKNRLSLCSVPIKYIFFKKGHISPQKKLCTFKKPTGETTANATVPKWNVIIKKHWIALFKEQFFILQRTASLHFVLIIFFHCVCDARTHAHTRLFCPVALSDSAILYCCRWFRFRRCSIFQMGLLAPSTVLSRLICAMNSTIRLKKNITMWSCWRP